MGYTPKRRKIKNSKANIKAKSLAILIKGKLRISFPDENKIVILEKIGDYVIWNHGVFHTVEILENTTTITVRWPSVPNDSISKVNL